MKLWSSRKQHFPLYKSLKPPLKYALLHLDCDCIVPRSGAQSSARIITLVQCLQYYESIVPVNREGGMLCKTVYHASFCQQTRLVNDVLIRHDRDFMPLPIVRAVATRCVTIYRKANQQCSHGFGVFWPDSIKFELRDILTLRGKNVVIREPFKAPWEGGKFLIEAPMNVQWR